MTASKHASPDSQFLLQTAERYWFNPAEKEFYDQIF